ncbi:putative ABC transporter, AAA+ ATPase domain, ABC-2 type transporter [Dioscorea sansibarensis]
MTVREILNFSAWFQGVGSRAEILKEVVKREKQQGITPDPEIDQYMKAATSVKGLVTSIQTDYVMKIMGMDVCADTMVGDAMRRGISGGQKKRLTTAEVIVGPTRALFMDEISTGLDSSTTFQIVTCLQQMAHVTEATIVISLLQPAPETYNLFDDVILMAEGKIVYQGPRDQVLAFFEECGFRCPERKGEADFLQEVLSRKDQEQYWYHPQESYTYASVDDFCKKFRSFHVSKELEEELSKPYDKSQCPENALSFNQYSLPKGKLFRACMARELLLMKRNSRLYIFKIIQFAIGASISMSVFFGSGRRLDVEHANYCMGSLFFTLVLTMVNGLPEIGLTVSRLPCFYKQRDFCFYPAWAYAIPAAFAKVPISLIESLIWTSVTYYGIGYSPEAVRFFRQFLILFATHQMALSQYRFLASYCQTLVTSSFVSSLVFLVMLTTGGFILPNTSIPDCLRWAFWVSPLTYTEIGLTVNEFLAPRWQKISAGNLTVGNIVLSNHGLEFKGHFYWVSVGALLGFALLFDLGFILSLTFRRRSVGKSRAIISRDKLSEINGDNNVHNAATTYPESAKEAKNKGRMMVLPFQPLAMTFQDISYCVDTPPEMREQGYAHKRLQLLHNITGAFRPGILSVLMGVSGAGKTTLLDVLSGRKTAGFIEGDIRIGGYPKMQRTFARISGYCEQTDIHSPQITVEESVIFSAWLRLPNEIDSKTRSEFVNEVLETIELDNIKDALVGRQGVNGLSTEQRKRLTIAVELVANPSILFMDEPTSGLDARAAAIVMRAVKNVAETGRTVVCTIHQPSIDIFEAFDELTLMKKGGELIYSGPLGRYSSKVIEYFEKIPGVPKIKENCNPATWMLEVTSSSTEAQLGVNFAQIYRESTLYNDNKLLVKQLSTPAPGSRDLHFSTLFPQSGLGQFKACLWKQYLSYWRSPSYNCLRVIHVLFSSVLCAAMFWKQGKTLKNQQNLFNILGSMYISAMQCGTNNCLLVMPFVVTERAVLYREKYAGMYSSWAYSLAQMVIEIPYVFIQVLLLMIITYPAIGYYWSAYKFLWFFYAMLSVWLSFVYLGMLVVSLSPSIQVASIVSSFFFQNSSLFSDFIIPRPHIPKWWIWVYYIAPLSWSLNGLFTSQYGDTQQEIRVFGETEKTVALFLQDYFGFHHDRLGIVALVLLVFPLMFAFLFACCIEKLNFQRR